MGSTGRSRRRCRGRAAPELGDGLLPSLSLDPRLARIVLQAPREGGTRREEAAPLRRAGVLPSGCAEGTSCDRGAARSDAQNGIPIPRPVAPAPRTASRACTGIAGWLTARPVLPGRPLG